MADQDKKPIIVNVGGIKNAKKRIKQLKNGEGKLADEVHGAIAEAYPDLANADVLPVVVLVEEKPAPATGIRRGGGGLFRLLRM